VSSRHDVVVVASSAAAEVQQNTPSARQPAAGSDAQLAVITD